MAVGGTPASDGNSAAGWGAALRRFECLLRCYLCYLLFPPVPAAREAAPRAAMLSGKASFASNLRAALRRRQE